MRQQPKRKDLVKRMFVIPEEIDNWLNEVCAKTNESRSLALTRLLESVKNIQKNSPES